MPKSSRLNQLTQIAIRALVKQAKQEGKPKTKTDGGNLYLTISKTGHVAWVFRYQWFGKGKERTLDEVDARQKDYGLVRARDIAAKYRKRVKNGEDVAASKYEEQISAADTFKSVANEWYNSKAKTLKHPEIIRRVLNKDIIPVLGPLHPANVKPAHVDKMLRAIVNRNAPTIANDALRYVQKIFTYARKRHIVEFNPVADFDLSDAGGRERTRTRALSREEIKSLFVAMEQTDNLMRQNELAFKILLATCVRKGELVTAKWSDFDLDAGIWKLVSSKTNTAITIPLAPAVIDWLEELKVFAAKSDYVLPARRRSKRFSHISPDTLNAALKRVEHGLEHFTVHDMRRTARTHLAALGISSEIAERALNHKLRGVEGVYNVHDYFKERKHALSMWANLLVSLEKGNDHNVVPLKKASSD